MDGRISIVQSLGRNPRFRLWREVHWKFLVRILISIINQKTDIFQMHWMHYRGLCPQVHVLWEKPRLPSFWAKEQTNSNRNVSGQRWTLAWRTAGFPGGDKHPQGKTCFKSMRHANLNTNLWFISPRTVSHLCFNWMFLNEKGRGAGVRRKKAAYFPKLNQSKCTRKVYWQQHPLCKGTEVASDPISL